MPSLDIDLERDRIARRRKLAEAMLAQSQQPMGGTDMVSGIAIRRSPLEGLAKVAQAYAGTQAQNKADEDTKALGDNLRQETQNAISDYTRKVTPRTAVASSMVEDPAGIHQLDAQPGYQPARQDQQAAAFELLGKMGGDPRDLGKMLVAQALKPEEIKAYKPGDVLYKGEKPTGTVIPSKPEPAPAAIKEYEYAKGQGYQGTFEDFQLSQRRAGATNVSVSTEKKYGEQFAGAVAKSDVDLRDSAMKAPDLASRANRIKETVASGKVITGAAADYRLGLGKAMGLVGASDQETIVNTETLVSGLAQNTLDAIKASGLGSGTGFSNADRDFLEKAVGGKITLESGTIDRLATLAHRAAEKSAQRWSTRVKEIPADALQGTGIKAEPITVPTLFGGKAGPRVSPETQRLLDRYAPVGATGG